MGIFGKLFEKKECAICGGEIGLLGNRKLEDGNMCKNCAAKLSPWFSDRRKSTVADIQEQLDYREANREKVSAFRTTRTLGESMKILLDEDAGVFMVTSARNLAEANPDVLAFSDVTGCNLDIDERKVEIKREVKKSDGSTEEVSYNPPRYDYEYDFFMVIHVRNPYFDQIRFKLNSSTVKVESGSRMGGPRMGMGMPMGMYGGDRPEMDGDYIRYKEMGEEIKAILLQVRQETRDVAAAAAAPKAAVTCPYCGATTTPNASGCCEFCGGAING